MTDQEFQDSITQREVIERISLVGKMERSQDLFDKLRADGWRVIQSGPYTDYEMLPDVDMARYRIVAEREVKNQS